MTNLEKVHLIVNRHNNDKCEIPEDIDMAIYDVVNNYLALSNKVKNLKLDNDEYIKSLLT